MKEQLDVYIFVEEGCITGVTDAEGTELSENVHIIDYDCKENGVCPVCGNDQLFLDDSGDLAPCEECGYSESEDNALACAVAYAKKEVKNA